MCLDIGVSRVWIVAGESPSSAGAAAFASCFGNLHDRVVFRHTCASVWRPALVEMRIPHIAVITGGRSPRPELLAELSAKLGQIRFEEFGALDGVSDEALADHAPGPDEPSFFAPLGGGANVVISVALMEEQVRHLVARLDDRGFDLIVIAATALFAPLSARTPIVHGQQAVDACVLALAAGDINIGLIFPLPRQGNQLAISHRTQIQSANATIEGGHNARL